MGRLFREAGKHIPPGFTTLSGTIIDGSTSTLTMLPLSKPALSRSRQMHSTASEYSAPIFHPSATLVPMIHFPAGMTFPGPMGMSPRVSNHRMPLTVSGSNRTAPFFGLLSMTTTSGPCSVGGSGDTSFSRRQPGHSQRPGSASVKGWPHQSHLMRCQKLSISSEVSPRRLNVSSSSAQDLQTKSPGLISINSRS